MKQLGMGSLLGVAQGSAEPPVLIILRYQPAGASRRKTGDHLALVGKGVTFDTGGISIKPAQGMEKMKYDMCGGAAVLGAMRAIAQLKPDIPVTGFVPAVENMVSSRAQRPGDIVKSLSGKTIEVLNTDAEGRLILNDAITYAKRLGCTHLVDAATLTGAIVVALGHVNTGAFTNNEDMLARVLAAAKEEGEKMWPMPLDDDYKELLKSAFADLANIGAALGRSHHRRLVPARIRRRHALGAPRHRRHRLARRSRAQPGQRPHRRLRPHLRPARRQLGVSHEYSSSRRPPR